MILSSLRTRPPLLLGVFLVLAAMPAGVRAQWPQFGGPTQDFTAPPINLATDWANSPPRLLWERPLGLGDSSVSVDSGALFTMYRNDGDECLIALSADDGRTIWKSCVPAPLPEDLFVEYGKGPHATPLVHDGRVICTGITGHVRAIDQKTGASVWSHDLVQDFGAKLPLCGYAASAVAWKKMTILPVGGPGCGVAAFDYATGEIAWKSTDSAAAYATPLIIHVQDKPQVVVFMAEELAALDPDHGRMLWRFPHVTEHGVNASMPVWNGRDELFISSAYGTGSRLLRLTGDKDQTKVEELWSQKRMEVQFGSVIRMGAYFVGSSGDRGPVFFTALNAASGEIAWRDRGTFGRASSLRMGDKLLVVDHKGKLAIVKISPETLDVLATHNVFDETSFSIPTLVGDRLFVRTPTKIMAWSLPLQ